MNFIYLLSLLLTICSLVLSVDLDEKDLNEVKKSRNFNGKVVLITGSTSGLGEITVKLFSALGAKVVVTGRTAKTVRKVAEEVQELSPKKLKPLEVVADVTKSDDLKRLLDQTIKTYGKLDVLVNNAGILLGSGARDKNFMPVFDQMIATNLRPFVELSYLSVPYLERTNGTIISTSSQVTTAPVPNIIAYIISKSGVDSMTQGLALELGPKIRVNSVNPGPMHTRLLRAMPKEFINATARRTPLKRLSQPIDIAKAVVFLASKDAEFITGVNLIVDGGLQFNAGSPP